MGRREFISVDELIQDWVSVSEAEDPIAFKAWADYRREVLHAQFVPKGFTVPSPFPPSTQQAADSYASIIHQIRKSVGWNDNRAKPWREVRAWR